MFKRQVVDVMLPANRQTCIDALYELPTVKLRNNYSYFTYIEGNSFTIYETLAFFSNSHIRIRGVMVEHDTQTMLHMTMSPELVRLLVPVIGLLVLAFAMDVLVDAHGLPEVLAYIIKTVMVISLLVNVARTFVRLREFPDDFRDYMMSSIDRKLNLKE